MPCEALPALYLPDNIPEVFRGTDVIWYIDNQAAAACLIKGSSSQFDVAAIMAAAHLNFARLDTRIYFEFIESGKKPADGCQGEA
jgi:hypothetical protein